MRRFIGLILTVVLTIAMIPSAYDIEESNINAASGTEVLKSSSITAIMDLLMR